MLYAYTPCLIELPHEMDAITTILQIKLLKLSKI